MIKRDNTLGFNTAGDNKKQAEQSYEAMKERVLGELKKSFRPEFLNRIDGVMVFHQLTKEQIRSVVDLELKRIYRQLSDRGIKLELDDDAKQFLADKGWDQQYGARPLRRAITNLVEDPLSEGLLAGTFGEGQIVEAAIVDGELKLTARDAPPVEEKEPEPEPATA
jgi:ATP-dependent Clp protease ATP-binding subunit ClpC